MYREYEADSQSKQILKREFGDFNKGVNIKQKAMRHKVHDVYGWS